MSTGSTTNRNRNRNITIPEPLEISVPPGARVMSNGLYATTDPTFLDQDLVFVELPGGMSIDVSWSPEGDPSGCYFITMFRHGAFDVPVRQVETRHARLAARFVEMFAGQWDGG
jgi:hypothetical protein